MANGIINKITILVGFLVGLLSASMALLTGGDIVFVIVQRFFLVFAIAAVLTWTTLTVINSIIISAARKSMVEMSKEFEHSARVTEKGQTLDFTSPPLDNIEDIKDLNVALSSTDFEKPEIKEFEPFKPRKIETDKGDSSQTN